MNDQPTPTTPHDPPEALRVPDPIPYPRFQEVIGERNRFKSELDAIASQQETMSNELTKAKQDLACAAASALRLRVAYASGLPLDLADRLVGEDEEGLKADAARLLQFVRLPSGPGVPPPPSAARPARLDVNTLSPEEVRKHKEELLRR